MIKPVLKIAGSMGVALFNELDKRKPNSFGTLIEGNSGPAIFSLNNPDQPRFGFDVNKHVVNAHNMVKDNPDELIVELAKLDSTFNGLETSDARRAFYSDIRDRINSSTFTTPPFVEQAALFICLTKLSFNGLLRTNSKGEINVPFGQKEKANICDESTIRAAHAAMATIHFEQGNFDRVLEVAKADDFVLLHLPPITGSQKAVDAGLVKLVEVFSSLDKNDTKVMLVLTDTDAVRDLFSTLPMDTVSTRSSISGKASGRGTKKMIVITNFPPPNSPTTA